MSLGRQICQISYFVNCHKFWNFPFKESAQPQPHLLMFVCMTNSSWDARIYFCILGHQSLFFRCASIYSFGHWPFGRVLIFYPRIFCGKNCIFFLKTSPQAKCPLPSLLWLSWLSSQDSHLWLSAKLVLVHHKYLCIWLQGTFYWVKNGKKLPSKLR